MNKNEENGYYAGVVLCIGGAILLVSSFYIGFNELAGQIWGVMGGGCIIMAIASFFKPESAGKVAWRFLKGFSGGGNSQSSQIESPSGGVNVNTAGTKNITNVTVASPSQPITTAREEMTLLVAPLWAKSRELYRKRYFMKGAPGYLDSALKKDKDYWEFWEKIELNRHLGIKYLRDALQIYFDNKSPTINAQLDPEYEKAEKQLIEKIEQRYKELTN